MTVFHDFNIKNDILMELFKKQIFIRYTNNSIQQYGSRFIQIFWAKYFKYGTVCAFDFLAENLWILRSIHAKPRAKPLIIVIENGRVRYGIMDKFG